MVKSLKTVFNYYPKELPMALLMSGYFFLVIAVFWILKPLKKGLFIEYYDISGVVLGNWTLSAAKGELVAKELNMVIAFFAMAAFSLCAKYFKRHRLVIVLLGGIIVGLGVFGVFLQKPTPLAVWSFYIFGDLFNMLMVAGFFAFLNDSVSAVQSKRLYGIIVLGGVLGGTFGSTLVRGWIDEISLCSWIGMAIVGAVLIGIIATLAGKYVNRHVDIFVPSGAAVESSPQLKDAASEGFNLVRKSRYLLSIAGIVSIYEMVSSIVDYQFTTVVSQTLDGPAIGQHFSTVYMVVNLVSLLVQLGITRAVMDVFGVTKSILVLPLFLLFGSVGFLIMPALLTGSLLCVADNGLNYSINQSSKEALYVIVSRQAKYSAKGFIDIFIQRLAKAVGVAVPLVVSGTFLRWLSIVVILLTGLWSLAARYAGKRFDAHSEEG